MIAWPLGSRDERMDHAGAALCQPRRYQRAQRFRAHVGRALGSIAIIAGAVAIRYTGWVEVDPILSILIALLIVWTAWDIIRESLNICWRDCRRASTNGRDQSDG
jgi:hypothetical protein